VPRLVSLTRQRVIYLAFELDRSWTGIDAVNRLPELWDGAGIREKKVLDICTRVIVNYNTIGRRFVEAD
jgi:hypothetical protein